MTGRRAPTRCPVARRRSRLRSYSEERPRCRGAPVDAADSASVLALAGLAPCSRRWDPGARPARRAHRRYQRQGQHPGDGRRRCCARRDSALGRHPSRTWSATASGSWSTAQLISPAEFADLVTEVLESADRVGRRHGPPTEFEVLTCAAFTVVRAGRCRARVVEVGLGGRLDATNAWQGGVAAITNVSLDHMEYLGDTVERHRPREGGHHQARRLRGHGCRRAALRSSGAARRALRVPLREVAPLEVLGDGPRAACVSALRDSASSRLGLLGRHQAANAAVALAACARSELADATPAFAHGSPRRSGPVDRTLRRRRPAGQAGMELRQPARRRPDILLDGAHNTAGAAALAATPSTSCCRT